MLKDNPTIDNKTKKKRNRDDQWQREETVRYPLLAKSYRSSAKLPWETLLSRSWTSADRFARPGSIIHRHSIRSIAPIRGKSRSNDRRIIISLPQSPFPCQLNRQIARVDARGRNDGRNKLSTTRAIVEGCLNQNPSHGTRTV